MNRVLVFVLLCATFSGCCTFCNRGDAFSNHQFREAKNLIAAADSVYWKAVKP